MVIAERLARDLYIADLRRRGLTTEQADHAGLEFVPNARLLGPEFPSVPAIYIPYVGPDGEHATFKPDGREHAFFRLRFLEDPPQRSFAKRKPQRYGQPRRSGVHLYAPRVDGVNWPSTLDDSSLPLILTEGEFKSLVATIYGFPCLGLGGVWNFATADGSLLPEFDAIRLKGRHVFIAYDSDQADKPDVQHAERRLAALLTKRGAIVHLVRLPGGAAGGKMGLDDFLQAKGAKALEAILKATPPLDPTASLIVEGTDVEIADSALYALAVEYGQSVVFSEGAFYAYRDHHWQRLDDASLRKLIHTYDGRRSGKRGRIRLAKGKIESVFAIMADKAYQPAFFADGPLGINCRSGFICFDNDHIPFLEDHRPDHRQRHCLTARWNPDANWRDAPLLRTLLEGCFRGDEDADAKSKLVAEIQGVAALGVATHLAQPQAIVFYGPGANNGKSQVLDMLKGLLPPNAVSAIPPAQFANNPMLASLAGRLLNACAELGTGQAIASDTFKSVVTGDQVNARQVYKQPIFFRPIALHVFATNVLPSFRGGFDRGVQRRLLPLLFDRSIPAGEQVPEIGRRIAIEEPDALLALAIEGASRVRRNGRFTEPASSRKVLREWTCDADPVLAWMEERVVIEEGHRLPVKVAYSDFQIWADGQGFRADQLPTAPRFASRVYAQRIMRVRNNTDGIQFIGLRLRSRSTEGSRGNVVRFGAG